MMRQKVKVLYKILQDSEGEQYLVVTVGSDDILYYSSYRGELTREQYYEYATAGKATILAARGSCTTLSSIDGSICKALVKSVSDMITKNNSN